MAKKTPVNLKSPKVEEERSLDEMLHETPEFEFDALRNVSMSSVLARLVLEDALTTRDCARIRGFKGVGIVVGVPSADWVDAIKNGPPPLKWSALWYGF